MRGALNKIGATEIETDSNEMTCSFTTPADFDFDSGMEELVERSNHFKGWKRLAETE